MVYEKNAKVLSYRMGKILPLKKMEKEKILKQKT